MPLPRPASPKVLWADMREFWRTRPRHQWLAATLAILIPVGIILAFYFDAQTNIVPPEQVIYVNDWPAARSDAEIQAKQRQDQARREALERERREQFQRIDEGLNRLGI
ncbi:hypothetical protein RCO27_12070 [Sphingosinicella sp. LHD-64]|uniref:hypothetical protein n=1 Tax=Sphingosinicella sp. LHD-64 TaxID=3072139 RepID=UPI00280E8308|nr:hypothetical protein [Sphingosinicella sp. LHD-64]MDQ8756964.1 hypothetical protein [Sphingosinicella sp. LHD-64]